MATIPVDNDSVDALIESIRKLRTTTIVGLVVMVFGAGSWATMLQMRIANLEKWAGERNAAIDEWAKWRSDVTSKLSVLDEQNKQLSHVGERVEQKLDILLENTRSR